MIDLRLPSNAVTYFATPSIEGNRPLAEALWRNYVAALVTIALDRCRGAADADVSSLLDDADDPDGVAAAGAARLPEIGALEAALVSAADIDTISLALVRLFLQLGAAGLIDAAELRLPHPDRLQWGTLILPAADRFDFRRDSRGIALELSLGAKTMRMDPADGACGELGRVERVPVARLGGRPVALWSALHLLPYPLPSGRSLWHGEPAWPSGLIGEADEIVATGCAPFTRWIADAIGSLVLLDGADGVRFSATVAELPGLTYLSMPLSALETAARLVHEASHQHFFALQRLTVLCDGTDKRLYHSPVKQRGRPLDIILFSFHAFGNGALFDRAVCEEGLPGARPNPAALKRDLETLEVLAGHLDGATALTPAGHALWRPVAERLFGRAAA